MSAIYNYTPTAHFGQVLRPSRRLLLSIDGGILLRFEFVSDGVIPS